MTVTFAFAQPLFALAAADTRTLAESVHQDSYNDTGELRLHHADGTVATYPARGRKLRRFPGGWAVGAGDFILVDRCLARLSKSNARTPIAIEKVLREAYQEGIQWKKQVMPRARNEELTVINYVYKVTGNIKIGSVALAGDFVLAEGSNIIMTEPGDVSRNVYNAAYQKITNFLLSGTSLDMFALVRVVASAFHDIANDAMSVSDITDMALLVRNEQGATVEYRLFADNLTIVNATDTKLQGMFELVS